MAENETAAMTERLAEIEARRALIRAVFGTEAGRRLLALWRARLALPTYAPGMSLDEVAFREGQKQVVREIEAAFDQEMPR